MTNINQTRPHHTKPNQTMKNAGMDAGKGAVTAGGNTLGKSVWENLKKLEINLSHDPAMPLLSVYPEDSILPAHPHSLLPYSQMPESGNSLDVHL